MPSAKNCELPVFSGGAPVLSSPLMILTDSCESLQTVAKAPDYQGLFLPEHSRIVC